MDATLEASASIEPLPLPNAAILSYVARWSAGALYVLSQPLGFPVQLGASQDVADALAAARKTWLKGLEPPILARCWWAHDTRACQEVLNLAVGNDLRRAEKVGPRLSVTLAEAEIAILGAAKRLSIGLTPHMAMLARAEAALNQIDTTIKAATSSGQLKFFNAEYAKRRREAAAQGREFISYNVAAKRLQSVLAGIAADRATGAQLNTAIIEQVFGPPGSKALWKR
jgi:hypothetical protein